MSRPKNIDQHSQPCGCGYCSLIWKLLDVVFGGHLGLHVWDTQMRKNLMDVADELIEFGAVTVRATKEDYARLEALIKETWPERTEKK